MEVVQRQTKLRGTKLTIQCDGNGLSISVTAAQLMEFLQGLFF
jgi:hypothetical protein